MAVGVETCSLLRPSTSVITQVMAHPIRHFAKPPGVIRHKIWDDLYNRPASMRGEDDDTFDIVQMLKNLPY